METSELIFSLFQKLRHLQPVLLQSGKGWSFICLPAEVQPEVDDDLDFLRKMEFLPREGVTGVEGLHEPPFCGGWVGFMTYNQGVEWMGIKSRHVCPLPKMWWRYCDRGVAVSPDGKVKCFGGFEMDLCARTDFEVPEFKVGEIGSNITWEEYEYGIGEVKKLLKDGETYQVNFAQQFSADFEGDPFGLYARMFQVNPAAMCFFAEGDEGPKGPWAVCSNSPERIVSLRNGVMRSEPVKGTVAHDEDPQFLLRDEKSYAELTMIVDLMRNDLGRVAKVGSVKVLEHQALMELKNVWHTYSVIEAELAEGKGVADMVKAVFPGGSIVGCPKKRTMEIIDRLVSFSWGAYCGSAGYVSLNGNADFNIMIRTPQVVDGRVAFGAGGGIVADSDAAMEYQETKDKAATFRRVVGGELI